MVAPVNDRSNYVAQFARRLKLMDYRVHELCMGGAFMVFDTRTREPTHGRYSAFQGRILYRRFVGTSPPSTPLPLPRVPWILRPRFVQFCFEKAWFALDLPNTIITSEEAWQLVDEGGGFFWNADRPDYRISSYSQIKKFDPVCKYYSYDDEREAAEDVAHIFFDIWRLPPGTSFRVKSAPFH